MPYGSGFKFKLAEDAVPNLFLPGNSHLLDTDTLISSHESIDVASTKVIKISPANIEKGTQTHDFFCENKDLKEKLCKAEAEIKNLKKENQKLEKQVEQWKVLAAKYKCEKCSKSFSKGQVLRRHIRSVHEGVKNYRCETCDKAFGEAHNLKKHLRTVHKSLKKYKCDKRGKSSPLSQYLSQNISSAHEEVRNLNVSSSKEESIIDFKIEIKEEPL